MKKILPKGFTIIEIMVYIAIASVLLTIVVNFTWNIIYGGRETRFLQEVQQNARFVMERITQTIRSASEINSPDIGNSADSLTLQMADPALNPTIFDISEGKIRLFQGESGPYELTTDELEVTSLNFINFSYADTPGTIRVELTIEYKNSGGVIKHGDFFYISSTASLR